METGDLCRALGVGPTGGLSEQLRILVEAGMLARDYAWNTSGRRTSLSKYRIRDTYLRFYLRYIEPPHVIWQCTYHIVWCPKYRYRIMTWDVTKFIETGIRTICEWKKVEIKELAVMSDHIRMVVDIPPRESIAGLMGTEKDKTAIKMFRSYPKFRGRGYGSTSNIRRKRRSARSKMRSNTASFEDCDSELGNLQATTFGSGS